VDDKPVGGLATGLGGRLHPSKNKKTPLVAGSSFICES